MRPLETGAGRDSVRLRHIAEAHLGPLVLFSLTPAVFSGNYRTPLIVVFPN